MSPSAILKETSTSALQYLGYMTEFWLAKESDNERELLFCASKWNDMKSEFLSQFRCSVIFFLSCYVFYCEIVAYPLKSRKAFLDWSFEVEILKETFPIKGLWPNEMAPDSEPLVHMK